VDFYAGATALPVGEIGMREAMSGVASLSLDQLAAAADDARRPALVLLRLSGPDALGDTSKAPAAERLARAGFMVTILRTRHHFIADGGRSRIGAALVSFNPALQNSPAPLAPAAPPPAPTPPPR